MAYAIVVNSRTGNTRSVADGIAAAIEDVAYFGDVPTSDDARAEVAAADAVLVGFWTDKGSCSAEVSAFLEELHGKRVFLFGTAGFGGSDSYFEQIVGRVAGNLPEDAELAGWAMCQGRMHPAIRGRYEQMLAENPGDARAKAMIENFDAALAHPDDADIEKVVAAVRAALA